MIILWPLRLPLLLIGLHCRRQPPDKRQLLVLMELQLSHPHNGLPNYHRMMKMIWKRYA